MARRRKLDPDEELDPDELEEKLEEEGNFDRRGLLKDGRSTRISLYMRDGSPNPRLTPTQRSIAATNTEDAVARRFGLTDGLQLHRPGFRRVTDAAALERSRQAYAAYDAADAVVYKPAERTVHTGGNKDYTGAGAPGRGSGAPPGSYPLSSGEGSACTINGAPGTLVRNGAWLECRQDAMGLDAKQQAYLDYDNWSRDAWRTGK